MHSINKIKKYLFSLKYYILFSSFVFLSGVFFGYFASQNYPGLTEEIVEGLTEKIKPLIEINSFFQFLVVFLNNAFTGIFIILFGIVFGLVPILSLFVNGVILGIFAFLSIESLKLSTFLLGILPHGIIEIPVLITAAAIGIKIGKSLMTKGDFKRELVSGLMFFLKILLPLVLLAAFIEIFITAKLLN